MIYFQAYDKNTSEAQNGRSLIFLNQPDAAFFFFTALI